MFYTRTLPASQRDPEIKFYECSECQLSHTEINEQKEGEAKNV